MARTLDEITIEVIQKCNSGCIYCSSLSSPNSVNEISLDKLKEIALFANEKQANNINISGGEPLLNEALAEFIDFCYKNELKTNIYTSGNVDFKPFLNSYYIKNIDKSYFKFIFNYHSSNPEIFDKLINCNGFGLDIINENIKLCLENNFDVEVHIVPNALNIDTIYETTRFLKEIGVKKVSLLRMVFQGRAEKHKNQLIIQNPGKLKTIIENIKNNLCDDNFTLRCGIPFNKEAKQDLKCVAGYKKLIIRYDGVVFPCEAFKEAPNSNLYKLGNIKNDSLQKIWDKYYIMDELKKLREEAQVSCESCPAQMLYR